MILGLVQQVVMEGSANLCRAFNDGGTKEVFVGQSDDEVLVALEFPKKLVLPSANVESSRFGWG